MKSLCVFVFFIFVAGVVFAQQLPLKEVIARSARDVEKDLREGTKVAVVNFTSPSEVFSEHVIEELIGELVSGKKVVVVDRRNLDLIRDEMNLQLSGDVSDESMLSVGRQLGAQYIVSGNLTNMGKYYRFRVEAINVETTKIQMQTSLNLKNDAQVTFLITDSPENSSDPSASVFYGKQKLALGTGFEMNMNSREDVATAVGMKLSMDYNISSSFAVGLNLGCSYSDIITLETAALLRWYFYKYMFAQANAGLWAGSDAHSDIQSDISLKYLLGATVGVRLPVARNLYIEPYARAGYPFMFGVGVATGFRLPLIKGSDPIGGMTPRGPAKKTEEKGTEPKETTFAEQVAEIVKEYKDDSIWLEFDSDGRLRLMVSVVFSADSAELKGLRPEIMASNERTLKYVADILKRTKYSSIVVEGHSNPTTPEGRARTREENELKRLSQLRALAVVNELIKYGVNLEKVDVQGAGSSRMVAPYNDAKNNWKNRRVEFILVQ